MNNRFQDDKIDLFALVGKLLSRWYVILLGLILTIGLAMVYLSFADYTYEVKSKILIKQEEVKSVDPEDIMSKGERVIEVQTEDEMGILTSLDLINKAVKNLNLGISYHKETQPYDFLPIKGSPAEIFGNPPFEIAIDSNNLQMINIPIYIKILPGDKYFVSVQGENVALLDPKNNSTQSVKLPEINIQKTLPLSKPFVSKYLNFRITSVKGSKLSPDSEYFFKLNNINGIVKAYQKRLLLEPTARESNIIEIYLHGNNPQKEIAFINELMRLYVEDEIDNKNQKRQKALMFIQDQLERVTLELEIAEQEIQSFKSSNNIIDINLSKNDLLQKLDRLESEKATLVGKLEFYNKILTDLQSQEDVSKLVSLSGTGLDHPAILRLLDDLSRLNRQKASLNYSAREDNPALKILQLEINTTKEALVENLKNVIHSSQIVLKDLNSQIAKIDVKANRLPANERRLVELQRKFDYIEEKHNFWLSKKGEASIALATTDSKSRVLDKAATQGSGPVSPKPFNVIIVAFLIGLAVPSGLIILIDRVSNKVTNKEELTALTDVPILGVIPSARKHNPINIKNKPRSVVSESFRTLYTNLNYSEGYKGSKTILISSLIPKEGKTFCAQHLATIFAMAGKKTVLIGLDLRKPKIHIGLDVNNDLGVTDYLQGKVELSKIIFSTPINNLSVIPSGPEPTTPAELLIGEPTRQMFDHLKKDFDYIIIDTPPINLVSDANILKQFSDANIFVVKRGYTPKDFIRDSEIFNGDKAFKNSGIILNNVKVNSKYDYYEN